MAFSLLSGCRPIGERRVVAPVARLAANPMPWNNWTSALSALLWAKARPSDGKNLAAPIAGRPAKGRRQELALHDRHPGTGTSAQQSLAGRETRYTAMSD